MLAKQKLPSEVYQSSRHFDKKSWNTFFFFEGTEYSEKLEFRQIPGLVSWEYDEGMASIVEDVFVNRLVLTARLTNAMNHAIHHRGKEMLQILSLTVKY